MNASERRSDPATSSAPRVPHSRMLRDDMILGVGTGSTVNALIDLLAREGWAPRLQGAVSSSEGQQRTAARPRAAGARSERGRRSCRSTSMAPMRPRARGQLIKGGGAALTREKIVAAAADRFVCIIDDSKLVEHPGQLPAAGGGDPDGAQLRRPPPGRLGGRPVWRQGVHHRQRQPHSRRA